jgi:hypothetical protein
MLILPEGDGALLRKYETMKHLESRLCGRAVSDLSKASGIHIESFISMHYIHLSFFHFSGDISVFHFFEIYRHFYISISSTAHFRFRKKSIQIFPYIKLFFIFQFLTQIFGGKTNEQGIRSREVIPICRCLSSNVVKLAVWSLQSNRKLQFHFRWSHYIQPFPLPSTDKEKDMCLAKSSISHHNTNRHINQWFDEFVFSWQTLETSIVLNI